MKIETRVGLFILVAIGIFLYLSINIKAFNFDSHKYYTYKAFFDDTGGLAIKAPVKIAGVEVGSVESIELLDNGKAEVMMRIKKSNHLAKNAYAMIHQDNVMGAKTLVIDPGTPDAGTLLPGSTLAMPGRTPASIGELLDQFRDIATTVQHISSAFKNVFASPRGEENMRMALNSVAKATDRLADFSEVLQKTMARNEENINNMLNDFRATAASLKNGVPGVLDDVHRVSKTLDTSVTKLTDDFSGAANKAGGAFEHIEDAAIQTKDTLREAGQVMEKVNTGKGVIGKLINEDETYGDLKKTIKGLRDYVGRTQALMLNFDAHSESMLRQSNNKGYFELRLRPNSDFFYLMQLVAAQRGAITRETTYVRRYNEHGDRLDPSLSTDQLARYALPAVTKKTKHKINDVLFGLQLGKRFDRVAVRFGLMENTAGFGVDYYVPLKTDALHWITSLEAWDFVGQNRLHDRRPHIKWLNKCFFLKNIYTSFGFDDVCSKRNANPFFGGGFRFGDDDVKYLLGSLPIKPGK